MSKLTLMACWLCCLSLGALATDRDLRPMPLQHDHSGAERVALVIGNSEYQYGRLDNPVNDARLIAKALVQADFTVITGYDLDEAAMRKKIREFSERLGRSQGVGLFYFAGHGAQYEGKNYLVPIKARIDYADELKTEGVSVDWVLSRMDRAANRLNILVLDACRNNPFPSSTREIGGGLTDIDASGLAVGTYIAYATGKNRVAADGTGANSPFSLYFDQALRTPGLELDRVFRVVRGQVKHASEGKQVPWSENAVVGTFFFVPSNESPAQPSVAPPVPSAVPVVSDTGHHFRDALSSGGQGPRMVVLPKGSYLRGESRDFFFDPDDEKPVRRVTIEYPIAMMTHEVTVREYERFVLATGRRTRYQTGIKPIVLKWGVDSVSWHDANAYAGWLSEETGKQYRLPSEAEWEYAARAGTTTFFFWGDTLGTNRAHCDTCGSQWVSDRAPVGSFKPNIWGLFDMHGNVEEWVADCYDDSYDGAPLDGSAKKSCDAKYGGTYVVRGGDYFSSWWELRSSVRRQERSSPRYPAVYDGGNDSGFRLVQDLNP